MTAQQEEGGRVARALDEVLAVWREAERVLEALPGDSPERRPVQLEVYRLRRMYRRLTDAKTSRSEEHLAQSLETLERARGTLARANERLAASQVSIGSVSPALLFEPEA